MRLRPGQILLRIYWPREKQSVRGPELFFDTKFASPVGAKFNWRHVNLHNLACRLSNAKFQFRNILFRPFGFIPFLKVWQTSPMFQHYFFPLHFQTDLPPCSTWRDGARWIGCTNPFSISALMGLSSKPHSAGSKRPNEDAAWYALTYDPILLLTIL